MAGYSFETTQSVSHNTLKPALQSWLPTYVAWSKSTTTWKLQAINGLLSKRDTTNDAPLYLPMYLPTYVYVHKFFQKCCSQQLRKKKPAMKRLTYFWLRRLRNETTDWHNCYLGIRYYFSTSLKYFLTIWKNNLLQRQSIPI